MSKDTERQIRADRQHDAADVAIARAVTAFTSKIVQMQGRWVEVHPHYIVERMLLALSDEMAKLIDDPSVARFMDGDATLKLSNALADYRDSQAIER